MSAPRDDTVYISHIRDSIARIESYLVDVSEETFLATPLIRSLARTLTMWTQDSKRMRGE